MDFKWIFRKSWSWSKKKLITFWCWSGFRRDIDLWFFKDHRAISNWSKSSLLRLLQLQLFSINLSVATWGKIALRVLSTSFYLPSTQTYWPGPWCDLLPLSRLLDACPDTSEIVLVNGCRPTVSSTLRISIRPSALGPGPLSKAAAAHRPATSMRMRNVGRSITEGPVCSQQISRSLPRSACDGQMGLDVSS